MHHVYVWVNRIQTDPEALLLNYVLKYSVLMLVQQLNHPISLHLFTKLVIQPHSKLVEEL